MEWSTLIDGYRRILDSIYSPKLYYERIRTFLREYRPARRQRLLFRIRDLWPVIKALIVLGVKDKGKGHFWRLLVSTLVKHPRSLREALTASLYGLHFRKVAEGGGTVSS